MDLKPVEDIKRGLFKMLKNGRIGFEILIKFDFVCKTGQKMFTLYIVDKKKVWINQEFYSLVKLISLLVNKATIFRTLILRN